MDLEVVLERGREMVLELSEDQKARRAVVLLSEDEFNAFQAGTLGQGHSDKNPSAGKLGNILPGEIRHRRRCKVGSLNRVFGLDYGSYRIVDGRS
ncbi:MAG: hypothetical protein R3F17_08055 [Planctomycetota bacterium]